MTRHPDTYSGAGEPVFGDVSDSDSLAAAMDGVDAAYYLVHSLDSDDFEQRDAEAATAFGHVAARQASGKSSISVASATSTTTCRRTCGRAGTSSSCSHSVGCR